MSDPPKIKRFIDEAGNPGYEVETDLYICETADAEWELEELLRLEDDEERELESELD